MRGAARLGLLVALWLLAWGELSVANLLSGAAVALALVVLFPIGSTEMGRARTSLVGLVRLGRYVATQLLLSNLVMAQSILRRRPTTASGVIAHDLAIPSEVTATLMTSIIALSPGTMTVDVADDASSIHVHFFDLSDPAAARATLERLEHLVTSAVRSAADERTP